MPCARPNSGVTKMKLTDSTMLQQAMPSFASSCDAEYALKQRFAAILMALDAIWTQHGERPMEMMRHNSRGFGLMFFSRRRMTPLPVMKW